MNTSSTDPKKEIQSIIDSAHRLGVELDVNEAIQWLTTMSAQEQEEIVLDELTGTFGHRVTMVDFNPEDLAHFRKIGRLVEFEDIPGKVETALALSGSAAQSKIQTYPGDADYFERVNIIAETREAACDILARIMREKALSTLQGETYSLMEVRFGSYDHDFIRDGRRHAKGDPISWGPQDIEAGEIIGTLPDSTPATVTWEQASKDPGWCKLDWVVADLQRKKLVNASNMLDVTWEAPDGSISPLDGFLDPFFQEVYLQEESVPVFSKLVKHVSSDALDSYVEALEAEVRKYTQKTPNYGKAAKRLYNIFRLTGRYMDAILLRELFDEPTTALYQIGALIRTLDESFQPGSNIDKDTILRQADQLIVMVTEVLEGEIEEELVRQLLELRALLEDDLNRGALSGRVSAASAELNNLVNNFFYEKLTAVPSINRYLEAL